LGLHWVWCPKYRRRVSGGRVASRCGQLLDQVAFEHGGEIVAREVAPDYVYLFVRVDPTDAPAQVVRAFKGRTALVLQHLREPAQVRKLLPWSPWYFAASVGEVSESTVRGYIEHPWDEVA
jgi:putative transposase